MSGKVLTGSVHGSVTKGGAMGWHGSISRGGAMAIAWQCIEDRRRREAEVATPTSSGTTVASTSVVAFRSRARLPTRRPCRELSLLLVMGMDVFPDILQFNMAMCKTRATTQLDYICKYISLFFLQFILWGLTLSPTLNKAQFACLKIRH